MLVQEQWKAQVFAESRWRGNAAQVLRLAHEPTEVAMHSNARASGAPATCFTWQLHDNDFAVRCYSPWGPIQCCGHGLLATAHVLHQQADVLAAGVRLHLVGQGAPLVARREDPGDRLWLEMPYTACRSTPVPAWAEQAMGCPPVAAAVAGEASGYWVFEIDHNVDLASLTVNLEEVARQTARAVIVTQKAKRNGFDFLLRYFAPQYGVDEDTVTGSANCILAAYWHGRTGQRQFRALQCSPAGGVVMSRLADTSIPTGERSRVAISGQVTLSKQDVITEKDLRKRPTT